ncbi:MAG: hypothetical protein ACREEW_12140, partial [Caulobacteraceae bacterium]
EVSRAALPAGRTQGLLIVTPEVGGHSDPSSLGFGGPVLVVLPKWRAGADPERIGWGLKAGLLPPVDMPGEGLLAGLAVTRRKGVANAILSGAVGSPLAGVRLQTGAIDSMQTLSGKGWTPVLVDETGAAVLAEAPGRDVFVLAEPDLLDTQGLGDARTLAAAVAIVRGLRAGDGPVIFDATLNGYKLERNPLRLMFDPPFLAVTLCLIAALALAGFQGFCRFGAVRRAGRAIAFGKEALVDNSAQLVRLAGREAKMAPAYAALTRKAAARAVGAPRTLSGDSLTDFLDRLGAQRGLSDTLAGLGFEAGRVEGREGLAALAGRLYRWRLEMTRERQ